MEYILGILVFQKIRFKIIDKLKYIFPFFVKSTHNHCEDTNLPKSSLLFNQIELALIKIIKNNTKQESGVFPIIIP